ncbi:MAG TPA: flippase-like domain-containing protein [Candidatus Fraserbacteria bacterium]|nr:flippase-like domain-containing protein [Candidatus Fraserbacteria bacterium]
MKRRLILAGSVLGGTSSFALIIWWVGGGKIWGLLARLGLVGFLALFADVALMIGGWLLSWIILLRAYGLRTPWQTVVRARLAGYAVSYLTPFSFVGGEPVAVYLLVKETGEPTDKLIAVVTVAKFLEGLTLLFFLYLGSFYMLFRGQLPSALGWVLLGSDLLLGLAMALGAYDFWANRLWGTRITIWLSGRLVGRLLPAAAAGWVRQVEEEIHQAFHHHWRATLQAGLVSFAGTIFLYLRPQVFFYFSERLVFSLTQLALIFALTLVLTTLFWITPAGLGVFEGGQIGIFALFGLSADKAVAFSLALKPLELFFVALGLSFLLRLGARRLWRAWAGYTQLPQDGPGGNEAN